MKFILEKKEYEITDYLLELTDQYWVVKLTNMHDEYGQKYDRNAFHIEMKSPPINNPSREIIKSNLKILLPIVLTILSRLVHDDYRIGKSELGITLSKSPLYQSHYDFVFKVIDGKIKIAKNYNMEGQCSDALDRVGCDTLEFSLHLSTNY